MFRGVSRQSFSRAFSFSCLRYAATLANRFETTHQSTGVQLNLPPLFLWRRNRQEVVEYIREYAEALCHSGFPPPHLLLRFFPDSSLIDTNTLAGLSLSLFREGTNVWWTNGLPEVYFSSVMECLEDIAAVMHTMSISPVVCLPTRLVVSQRFLDSLFGFLSSQGWSTLALELPANRQMMEGSVRATQPLDTNWCSLGSIAKSWTDLVPQLSSVGSVTLDTLLPLHVLFPWVLQHGYWKSVESWLVVDTIPHHPSAPSTDSERTPPPTAPAVRGERRTPSRRVELAKLRKNEEEDKGIISCPSPDVLAVLQNVLALDQTSLGPDTPPILSMEDLSRFCSDSGTTCSADGHEAVGPVHDAGNAQSVSAPYITSLEYWSRMSELLLRSGATRVLTMPTFHYEQAHRWLCDLHHYAKHPKGTLHFTQICPPMMSVTELRNQALLREGVASYPTVSEPAPGHALSHWLPLELANSLREDLERLPAAYRESSHHSFFGAFSSLRSPRRGPTRIHQSAGTVRISPALDRTKLFLLAPKDYARMEDVQLRKTCPTDTLSDVRAIQSRFRHITGKAAREAVMFWKRLREDHAADAEPPCQDASSSVMLGVLPPGLRDDALRDSWKLISSGK